MTMLSGDTLTLLKVKDLEDINVNDPNSYVLTSLLLIRQKYILVYLSTPDTIEIHPELYYSIWHELAVLSLSTTIHMPSKSIIFANMMIKANPILNKRGYIAYGNYKRPAYFSTSTINVG